MTIVKMKRTSGVMKRLGAILTNAQFHFSMLKISLLWFSVIETDRHFVRPFRRKLLAHNVNLTFALQFSFVAVAG